MKRHAPSPLGPGTVLGGKFRLERRLAGGGMGSVWLAKHEALDAEVAVKLMSALLADTPTAMSRFEREAKASAQLKSLHICKVHDYGVEEGTPFMVMERLEGEDLGDRLNRVGRIAPEELVPLVQQMAKALTVAHAAGIVHRDLKPSNVFLVREGGDDVVKLLDFGIARELSSQLVDEKTSSGTVIGSPHHMSPEQARGEPVDHRSDLWSFGVILFRALTGRRPFDEEQITAVMLAIVSKPIPLVRDLCPDLPREFDAFFARALSREVEGRFSSANEMAQAFAAIVAGRDASAWLYPSSPGAPVGRDEPTVDGVPGGTPASLERVPSVSGESTASRELRAVTTGTGTAPESAQRRSALRVIPWALAAIVVGVGGFWLGRRGEEPPPAPAVAASQAPPAASATAVETAAPPAVTPVPPTSATGTQSATAAPAASARPRPAAPAPARPRQVDPFTGLPIP